MSAPTLSDIVFKNKMDLAWTTLKLESTDWSWNILNAGLFKNYPTSAYPTRTRNFPTWFFPISFRTFQLKSFQFLVFSNCPFQLKSVAYFEWPSSIYCPKRNSDQMTIEKMYPTLHASQKRFQTNLESILKPRIVDLPSPIRSFQHFWKKKDFFIESSKRIEA